MKKKTKKKKITEKILDKIYSDYIRQRDNWTCQMCGISYPPPTNKIQCSHYFSRIFRATRYDDENCDALCDSCHLKYENDKNGFYYDFKVKQIGPEAEEELRMRHYQEIKRTIIDKENLYAEIQLKAEKLKRRKEQGIIFGNPNIPINLNGKNN